MVDKEQLTTIKANYVITAFGSGIESQEGEYIELFLKKFIWNFFSDGRFETHQIEQMELARN